MDIVARFDRVLIGNTIEAAADLGGMAAALGLFIPLPISLIVVAVAAGILALQIWGSYELIRNVFRWLALVLLAYIGSAVLAKPDMWEVVRGSLVPTIQFSRELLSILVAIIGTTLSAYLYTWQSNVEVEEEIAQGRTKTSYVRRASTLSLEWFFPMSSCTLSFSPQVPRCTRQAKQTLRQPPRLPKCCGPFRER